MDVGFVGHVREGRRGSGAALRVREREGERWCRLSSSRHTFKNEKKEFIALSSSFLFVSLDSVVCHCPKSPAQIGERVNRFMHVCMHTRRSDRHRSGKEILVSFSSRPYLLFSSPSLRYALRYATISISAEALFSRPRGKGEVAGGVG